MPCDDTAMTDLRDALRVKPRADIRLGHRDPGDTSGWAKDAAFGLLRLAVDLMPPDAFVFVSVGNEFRPTAKLLALGEAKLCEILDAGHDRHHRAVAEGLLTVQDVLQAIAQTPTKVCVRRQPCTSRGVSLDDPPTTVIMPQESFKGRLKMYGAA